MITDPVCGMRIEAAEAKASLRYEGRDYHFCSVGCRVEFERHPEDYANRDQEIAEGSEDV